MAHLAVLAFWVSSLGLGFIGFEEGIWPKTKAVEDYFGLKDKKSQHSATPELYPYKKWGKNLTKKKKGKEAKNPSELYIFSTILN